MSRKPSAAAKPAAVPPPAAAHAGSAAATALPAPNGGNKPLKHLWLIDGSGYIFRAFHALPPMNRPDGTPINAVYGFCNMITKFLLERPEIDHIAVIHDYGERTFRNEIYPKYKAHRPELPEALVPQFPLLREANRMFGLPCVEMQGYEADDLIATYARLAVAADADVTIVSSDKDLMQLVGDRVSMFDPIKLIKLGPEAVMDKFGVPPEKVVDVQALAGDSTDNVPGVPGIGVKTAAQLITEYGDLETLLARAGEIKQPKRREALQVNAEQARISRRLVLLKDDVPVTEQPDSFDKKLPDLQQLVPWLEQQGFRALLAKYRAMPGAPPAGEAPPASATAAAAAPSRSGSDGSDAAAIDSEDPLAAAYAIDGKDGTWPSAAALDWRLPREKPFAAADYELVTSPDGLDGFISAAHAAGVVAVACHTNALAASEGLVGIAMALPDGPIADVGIGRRRAVYVPLGHRPPGAAAAAQGALDLGGDVAGGDAAAAGGGEKELVPGQLAVAEVLARLKPLLEDPGVLKVGHNIKHHLTVLGRCGISLAPVDDAMLLSFVLEGGLHGHGMDELAEHFLGVATLKLSDLTGTGAKRITFDRVAVEKARDYAAEDADAAMQLWLMLKPRLAAERMATLYETVERPLISVLADMEGAGVKIDAPELMRLSAEFERRMAALEIELHKLAGRQFNVGSPKQLGEILFDEMKLPGGKRNKSGTWSTDASVLEELAEQGHELPRKLLEHRQLAKLKGTYTDALVAEINPRTKRVHTSYQMTGASTGRLASTDPNLQNIPVRTEDGRKIRRAFIAEAGHKLLSADYSQIELRLLAHVADIPSLREAFERGDDIHAITASEVFGIPAKGMDPLVRRRAKAINFGIIYGISPFGLAAQLGIPQGEARTYIDTYFKRYPGIRDYMERTKAFCRKAGYVQTPFGRKVHLAWINDKNPARRSFHERAAINAPLQGGAADIIKRAMIRLPSALQAASLETRMLLQVHDELVFEAPDAEIKRASAVIQDTMQRAARLSIPLVVEIGSGMTWADAH
ncbi:DNA polymerase I [Vineibacter terrae]|uniref:DNA polymerase I n=1 Tax=Vineibacter terrae TaxID=2586908 RepID=A0A5C8PN59_9HYPH|nr:DNA polymerase I [Vineibacter terrae]TXL74857.1 DNA polymerase I [Vineibacter terrae]